MLLGQYVRGPVENRKVLLIHDTLIHDTDTLMMFDLRSTNGILLKQIL